MATLYPENSQYMDKNRTSDLASKMPGIVKALQDNFQATQSSKRPASGLGSMYKTIKAPSAATESMIAGKTTFPLVEAIGEQQPTKTQAIPEDYSGFWSADTSGQDRWVAPSSEAVIRNYPTALGGGQYVTDPTQAGKLIKSNRGVQFKEDVLIRGGLSPKNFQIDHVIPLWLGGADTLANRQVLDVKTHAEKTKTQAVALTLLANNKIDLNEAKRLAFTWKDKNKEGIPDPDDTGLLPLQTAESIYSNWKKAETEMPGVTWQNFKEAVPEVSKNFGQGWLPAAVREFLKGGIQGLSAGWIAMPMDDDYKEGAQETTAKVGRFAGNVLGTIVGFGKFAKLATGAANVASKLGAKAFSKKLAEEGAEIGTKALLNPKQAIRSQTMNRVLKDVGLMTAYGQLSNLDDKSVEGRVERFFYDTMYGGLLGTAGQSLKGYATVGAGSLALGLMEDQNIEDALLQSAIITGLHGMGRGQYKKQQADLEQKINDEATKAATSILGRYSPKVADDVKAGKVFGADEVETFRKQADTELNRLASTGALDLEEIARERAKIATAARQLYKTGLPKEARLEQDAQDLITLARQLPEKERMRDFTTPQVLYKLFDDPNSVTFLPKRQGEVISSGEFPTGAFRVAGLGSSIGQGKYKQNFDRFIKAKEQGDAMDRVFLVDRPELAPFFRWMDESITPEQIKNLEKAPSKNPQNAVQVFGVVKNKTTGTPEFIDLGWVPRDFKNNVSNTAYNRDPLVQEGKLLKSDIDKDMISTPMKEKGVSVLTADIIPGKFGYAERSKEPYMMLSVDDQNWKESLGLKNKIGSPAAQEGVPSAIARVNSAKNAQEKVNSIKSVTKKLRTDADEAIARIETTNPTETASKNSVIRSIDDFKQVIGSAKSPADIKTAVNSRYGEIVDDATAKAIYDSRNDFSVNDFFKLLQTGIKEGKANVETSLFYTSVALPFFRSASYRNSPLKEYVGSMPIYSGNTPVASKKVAKPKTQKKQVVEQAPVTATEPAVASVPVAEATVAAPAASKAGFLPALTETGKLQTAVKAEQRAALKRAMGPKKERINAIENEMYSKGEDILNDFKQSKGSDFTRSQYIAQLKERINSLDTPVSNKGVSQDNAISQLEYKQIKDDVKQRLLAKADDLVNQKYDTDNEIEFTAGIKNLTKAQLSAERNRIKTDTRKKLGLEVDEPKVAKPVTDIDEVAVSNARAFADTIKTNLKNQPKNSYSYGYSKMIDDGLTKLFGKNYAESKELGKYLGDTTDEGKEFWNSLYQSMNSNARPASQTKDVIKRFNIVRDQKSGALNQKDYEYIYGKRKKETSKAAEDKATQQGDELADVSSELKEELQDAGMGVRSDTQADYRMVSDLTRFDDMSKGRLAQEFGGRDTASRGIADARNFITELTKQYNANAGVTGQKKLPYVKFENLEKAIKSAAKVDDDVVDLIPDLMKETKDRIANITSNVESLKAAERRGSLPIELVNNITEGEQMIKALKEVLKNLQQAR